MQSTLLEQGWCNNSCGSVLVLVQVAFKAGQALVFGSALAQLVAGLTL